MLYFFPWQIRWIQSSVAGHVCVCGGGGGGGRREGGDVKKK